METDQHRLTWRKSSRSHNNSSCVEVAELSSGIGIRDTKYREAGHIIVTPEEWCGFLATFAK